MPTKAFCGTLLLCGLGLALQLLEPVQDDVDAVGKESVTYQVQVGVGRFPGDQESPVRCHVP